MLRRRLLLLLTLVLPVFVAGCAVLPGYGPSSLDVTLLEDGEQPEPDSYMMVRLNTDTVDKINSFRPEPLESQFGSALGGARGQTVGVGDSLVVNIWEPSQDGVFATQENKQTTLQTVVDEEGKIFIPYAGRITAAGRKVESVRRAIEQSLQGKAIEPQVQVLVIDNQANAAVVVGDVNAPGQYPIPVQGMRLMEAIAKAGGNRAPTYETVATITRGSRSATIRLDEVVSVPANNIWLAPGDNVLVLHKPRTYPAFGAVKTPGLMSFKTEKVSLSEALAQVGGLHNFMADAGGVFLFRFENAKMSDWLVSSGKSNTVQNDGLAPDRIPVVYRLDFNRPQAFFIAQRFLMRDQDVLYVANHPTAELGKFLATIVSPLISLARTGTSFSE
jgi:polysaccharide export outer membrane protein